MTSGIPLYERDPDAWNAHLAEGNARQARKRVSADALIRDRHGRILLVDPGYKPGWDLPGGMAEANEPPAAAVQRELNEELGINLHIGRLLCVDWVPPHGPWDDILAFIFDGGLLPEDTRLRLIDGELDSYEFCDPDQAAERLQPRTLRRMQVALEVMTGNEQPRYLHDGSHPGQNTSSEGMALSGVRARKVRRS